MIMDYIPLNIQEALILVLLLAQLWASELISWAVPELGWSHYFGEQLWAALSGSSQGSITKFGPVETASHLHYAHTPSDQPATQVECSWAPLKPFTPQWCIFSFISIYFY